MEITYPDRAPFLEAVKRVYEKWADKVGDSEKINVIINVEYSYEIRNVCFHLYMK